MTRAPLATWLFLTALAASSGGDTPPFVRVIEWNWSSSCWEDRTDLEIVPGSSGLPQVHHISMA
jgi:hypothetical protein